MMLNIKYLLVTVAFRVLEFFSKLIGAFDSNKVQISKDNLIVTFGPSKVQDGLDLKIMAPSKLVMQDPEYVKRTAELVAWVMHAPDHYWYTTELGIDVMEEAARKLEMLTNLSDDKIV